MRRVTSNSRARSAAGFTLLDVLVLIVLVGSIAAGMTTLFSRLSTQSAQTLRMQQSLAAAQALLEEVHAMPFTYCDPNDARAAIATRATVGAPGCQTTVDALGPEPGESRYGPNRFDGVSDYQGFTMPGPGCPGGLCDVNGNVISPAGGTLTGCSAQVTVTPQALTAIAALDANGVPQVLLIGVTVSCPGIGSILVEGIRTRYAPNYF